MKAGGWYVNDPEDGVTFHGTEVEARTLAESILDDMREHADEGWPSGVDDLHWGKIETCYVTKQVNVVETPGCEFDSSCDYEFVEES